MSRHGAALTQNLLTTADAAQLLGLSPDMVRLLARERRLLPAAKSRRGVRMFRREDVEALAADRGKQRAHYHVVQFYEQPSFLEASVADFLAEGLNSRGPVLVFATPDRRRALLELLAQNGHDVEQACAGGQLTLLDARESLARFMVGRSPDPLRFRQYLGPLIDRSRTARARFRVYGEMVDLLCKDGLTDAALRFEELWNELACECRLSRLCAYSLDSFRTGDDALAFERVCAFHTHVVPTERYSEQLDEQERRRRVAILEQQARALRVEIELRRQAERRLQELESGFTGDCSTTAASR